MAGPSAHNVCVSGCQNREAFNSLQIPSWPKGRFARGKSLQDDRYSTRNGISRVARPVFRNSSNLVVFQSTQKPLHRGFCAHCSPISCNLSSVLSLSQSSDNERQPILISRSSQQSRERRRYATHSRTSQGRPVKRGRFQPVATAGARRRRRNAAGLRRDGHST